MKTPSPKRSGPRPIIRHKLTTLADRIEIEARESGRKGFGFEFGLIATFSFAFSGATNWWMFYNRWHIDYFAVATPQDVVVNGFLMTATIIGMSILITALILAWLPFAGLILASVSSLVNKRRVTMTELVFTTKPTLRIWASPFGFILIGTAIVVTGFLLFSITRPYNEYFSTGIYVSRRSDLPKECWGQEIRWMGSEATIIECGDEVRIEREFERIQMYHNIGG